MSTFLTGNYYDIYDSSRVNPSFDLNLPSVLRITNGSLKEVDKNGAKSDDNKSVTRSIIQGTINYEFTNRIPIAMSFRMCFLRWNATGAHNDTLFRIIPDSTIKASVVDINGVGMNPAITNLTINLSGAQIDTIMQTDSVYFKLDFNTGNGLNPVKLRSDDYIGIRASLNARYIINKP